MQDREQESAGISRRKLVAGAAVGAGALLGVPGVASAARRAPAFTSGEGRLHRGLAAGMYGGPTGFKGAERYQYPLDSEEGRAISALRAMKKAGTAPDTIVVQTLDFAKPQFEKAFPKGARSIVKQFGPGFHINYLPHQRLKLVEVDAVPYSNPMNYVKYSSRLAEELDVKEAGGAVWANQFDNVANREAHLRTTGPEIWAQTGGRIDGFICAVGSGGTLAGVAQALREKKSDVQVGLADPHGAALYSWYTDGELKAEGTSISEGIGQGRVTANLEGLAVDRAYRVSDEEMLAAIYDLVEHEGLVMGGSTGINVAGALRMAKDMGPGHTIVTVLCDHGQRYQSKIFNPAFLREKGLPTPPWIPG